MLDADTIVIGSGSGGMTAAAALAQSGERVLVLEQHDVPGGWCHSFTREGYHFSPGVHYVGQLEAGDSTASIYEGLGVADDLLFFQLDPNGFERAFIAGERFDYCRGEEQLRDRFIARFPSDARGLADYFRLAGHIFREIPKISEVERFVDFLTIPFRTRHLGRYGFMTLKSILEGRIRDPLARAFLSIQCGDHGMPPRLAPFGLHAGVMGHYFNGGYYPMGGGMSIPLALRKSLKKHGGEIRLKTRVARILLEGRRAIGVQLSDGSELRAKRVVSNADPCQTYQRMVGVENLSRGLRRKLERTQYSMPSISLFFAADCDVRELGMSSANIWYYRDADFDSSYDRAMSPALFTEAQEFDGLFLTALSLKDPTQFNGRQHTLEAVTFVGYEAFRAFENSTLTNCPAKYAQFKEKITRMMFRTLERALPGITRHIVYHELGTPITNRDYVNATDGACYGTQKSRSQIGPFSYRPKSEIENLFLCGASMSAHGVSGAAGSGLETAAAVLGCRRRDLLKKTGQRMRTVPADNPGAWPEIVRDKIARAQKRHATSLETEIDRSL